MHLTRNRGFSLIEATLSVVVVGVMLVAAMRVLGASVRTRASGREQARAILLARRVLEEVMQKHYTDPDSDVGETRATFDDVDDYNGWTQTLPTDVDGTPLDTYTGWTISVAVAYADPLLPAQNGNSASGLKRIAVTITASSGAKTTLTGLRAQKGMVERQLQAQRIYTGFSNVKIRAGNDKAPDVVVGINPLNQVP